MAIQSVESLIAPSSLVTVVVLGAVGVLLAFRIALDFELLQTGTSNDDSATPSMIDCPSVVRTADGDVCEYCEEPLHDDSAATDSITERKK